MKLREKRLLKLAGKYNVPGPRYTSYPTAVQFTENFGEKTIESLKQSRLESERDLSLYFHIPFCFSLCWYCGCTKIITKDRDRGDHYLDYLEKEAALIQQSLNPIRKVRQIHFGGGTPTFLTPAQLRRLGEIICHYFYLDEESEFSVEIDPRSCSEEQVIALREIGVNRASLGVQDTNEQVQKAIHRIQPFSQTRDVTGWLRKHGINNINFDLIYGLPRQTTETFSETMKNVISLNPDRLAVYSYAHIPSLMPAQKLLNEEEFPSTDAKLQMLINAIRELPELGYRYIGMDHFAREEDELSMALDEGTLQRNFQGYSTHAELDMIALGMSGISQGRDLYVQNEKDLGAYYRALDEGRLPIKKVLPLNDEDRLRRFVIMQIMCKVAIDYETFRKETGINFTERFEDELDQLSPLEADGLLQRNSDGFVITDVGRLFLRNVAMVFDGYIDEKKHRTAYSKTV
ncbi:MAG: oxygen-independent coproporphyrinogen III oxidase [Balneolaceae bacterium]|nr:oxygen-independent coproporphyrinogen III oxidase [Balneolaceae bacterium]MCH8550228.1 oxygen-independent coproporphyrinogen III oxidase [Balneolaceae bacterium]